MAEYLDKIEGLLDGSVLIVVHGPQARLAECVLGEAGVKHLILKAQHFYPEDDDNG